MNIFYLLFTQPLANGLVIFYRLLGGNLGLAIIVFSVFLRFVLSPLTKPYLNSMKKMKDFGPQLAKLKKKYQGDQQKYLKAQADFYKEKGINPGAGCLPYLIQILILISFFNVFRLILQNNGDIIANFNQLLYPPLKFLETETIAMNFLGMDLTQPDVLHFSFLPFALPGPTIILAAIAQGLSAKLSQGQMQTDRKASQATRETADDFQVAMQNSAIYTFPLMTLIIGMRFASGLALYWLVFSLYQLAQQGAAQSWFPKINLLKFSQLESQNGQKSKKQKS